MVDRARRRPHSPRPTHGAGANDKTPTPKPADREALGRSRSGLSTKIHLLADFRCRPLARVVTAGQHHDSVAFRAADAAYMRSPINFASVVGEHLEGVEVH